MNSKTHEALKVAFAPAIAAAAIVAALAATAAQAGDPALPPLRTAGAMSYLDGGVTIEEAEALQRIAPQYPLRVLMTARSGSWEVADRFRVLRGAEVVAELDQAGPWLLMRLPEGRYRLEASFAGRTETREVRVGQGQTVHWVVR